MWVPRIIWGSQQGASTTLTDTHHLSLTAQPGVGIVWFPPCGTQEQARLATEQKLEGEQAFELSAANEQARCKNWQGRRKMDSTVCFFVAEV